MSQPLASHVASEPAPPPAGPMPGRQVLNLEHLRVFTLGNVALEREVLGLFEVELPQTLAEIEAGIATDKPWYAALHKLKGSAHAVGAERLGDRAKFGQQIAIENGEARGLAIAALRDDVAAVRAAIAAAYPPV